jgi:hypothetical protein
MASGADIGEMEEAPTEGALEAEAGEAAAAETVATDGADAAQPSA